VALALRLDREDLSRLLPAPRRGLSDRARPDDAPVLARGALERRNGVPAVFTDQMQDLCAMEVAALAIERRVPASQNKLQKTRDHVHGHSCNRGGHHPNPPHPTFMATALPLSAGRSGPETPGATPKVNRTDPVSRLPAVFTSAEPSKSRAVVALATDKSDRMSCSRASV
jgi:hypothetical protein